MPSRTGLNGQLSASATGACWLLKWGSAAPSSGYAAIQQYSESWTGVDLVYPSRLAGNHALHSISEWLTIRPEPPTTLPTTPCLWTTTPFSANLTIADYTDG
jgi:hypothetical protein